MYKTLSKRTLGGRRKRKTLETLEPRLPYFRHGGKKTCKRIKNNRLKN